MDILLRPNTLLSHCMCTIMHTKIIFYLSLSAMEDKQKQFAIEAQEDAVPLIIQH